MNKSNKILLAITAITLGTAAAAPSAFAHATFNVSGYSGGIDDSRNKSGSTGGTEVWTNGAPSEWMSTTATQPSIGYLGMHSNNSTRGIQTGVYGSTAAVCAANLDCVAVNADSNTLRRQVYNYNHGAGSSSPAPTDVSLAVDGNSWGTGISTANTGLDWGNIHASASTGATGNLESNLIALGANYLNITLEDDTSDNLGAQQLGLALYGGWDHGGGLSSLTPLTSRLAASAGGSVGISMQMFGVFNGEYTVAVGDNSPNGGQYKLTLNTSSTPLYPNAVVQAVPVPAAVWLMGSALTGMATLARRKRAVA